MMILLRLSGEFFFIGAFSVGGGMATIPFLTSLAERTGWFSLAELTSMIAIAESTPGPIGINIATYVGFTVSGVPGAVLSVLFLTLPSFLIIFLMAKVIQKIRHHHNFEAVFYGLRPASVGLITGVLISLILATFFTLGGGSVLVHWKAAALFLVIALCLFLPRVRDLPTPLFFLFAALAGLCLRL